MVTGTPDRQVLVWPLPSPEEVEKPLTAEVTLVEPLIETSTRQVRICAEVTNPTDLTRFLMPGTTVTLAIYPAKVTR